MKMKSLCGAQYESVCLLVQQSCNIGIGMGVRGNHDSTHHCAVSLIALLRDVHCVTDCAPPLRMHQALYRLPLRNVTVRPDRCRGAEKIPLPTSQIAKI